MSEFDLIVIGGGEAGIAAALRGAQLGAKVCLIDREQELGGGCVKTGTLPSKTLSNAARFLESLKNARRYGIRLDENPRPDFKAILESRHKTTLCELGVLATHIKRSGVEVIRGEASFAGPKAVVVRKPDGGRLELEAARFIIAAGSRPVELPGLKYDGRTVISTDELTSRERIPDRMLIVGAGVVGCEMAFIFRALGAAVTLVEKTPAALPGLDRDIAAVIAREFKRRGIEFLPATTLDRAAPAGPDRVRASLSDGKTVEADFVLVAAGRVPNTSGLNLAAAGVETGARSEILVDERMATSAAGIYAAGDVLSRIMLSSVAVVEARVAAENALGHASIMDYRAAPWGIYTDPEIGAVGLTEEQAAAQGTKIFTGRCGLNDLVRSCLDGNITGFIKLIFEEEGRRLVGAHIVGQDAAELIHFAAACVRLGATAEDIKDMIFNHPTISEGFAKAAAEAAGHPRAAAAGPGPKAG